MVSIVADRYSDEEIRTYYENGAWVEGSFFDMVERQAEKRGSEVFVFDDSTSLTFGEYRDRAIRLAVGLRRLGLEKGDRVAVQLPNWTEFAVIAAAVSRIGCVIVPIMPIYRDDEVGYVLTHSGARVAVTCSTFKGFDHAAMFERLRAQCPNLAEIVVARTSEETHESAIPLESLCATGSPERIASELGPDTHPDDGFLIVYTSGTTARPKGCYHTVNTVRASAIAIAESLNFTESDVQFGPSPITHSTGLMTSVILPLLVGAKSYLMEAWNPEAGLDRIAQHGCTVTVTATAFLQMLLTAYDPARHETGSMRLWVCAGSPIPGSVVDRARETLPACHVLSLYGRSESFLNAMCTLHDDPRLSSTTDGRALGGASLRVVGTDGRVLPRGEEGDIAYRGPSHMLEYFRDPEQTAALFTDEGYSRSGDLGYMDNDGYVRVTGRTKDIVIRGGLNISARELEDLLIGHPFIADVAVVGMPDERLGEKVCAYVVAREGHSAPSLSDVVEFLRSRKVATPKLPERLELVAAFPMTATGKIKKHDLREDIAHKMLQERGVPTG
jgi:acyl-CoA synthetase (AMP-forming)/AMP-acid ligase II